ncbi:zinc-dependent alcohol dehydrogenase [Phytohabitans kaempferiae]|uniref:Zinc-binding alcohol dehydrogenase n=1 Tax=Phytohabitans kaempferiae TaxID=1620943 RepID=A0ABV6MA38_9ACTN
MNARIRRTVVLTAPGRVDLAESPSRPLKSGEARLRSLYNGISHGTEIAHYRGTGADLDVVFDSELRVFRPRPEGTSPYPMPMGYETVARVTEVAPDVTDLTVGDLVHVDERHADEIVIDVAGACDSDLYPLVVLPPAVTPEAAVYTSLACVALQAVHDARIKVGDAVAVFGLGAVGLLAIQLARRNGATWVVGVDPVAERRALAERTGATLTIDPVEGDAGIAIKERAPATVDGDLPPPAMRRGVDIAIETSGSYAALHEATRATSVGGRVVTPAGYWYGGGEALRLGAEWMHNRVEMVPSFGVGGNPHRDHPRWNRRRMMRTVTALLADGTLDVGALPVRTFSFDEAPAAYAFVDTKPTEAIKVALRHDVGSGA